MTRRLETKTPHKIKNNLGTLIYQRYLHFIRHIFSAKGNTIFTFTYHIFSIYTFKKIHNSLSYMFNINYKKTFIKRRSQLKSGTVWKNRYIKIELWTKLGLQCQIFRVFRARKCQTQPRLNRSDVCSLSRVFSLAVLSSPCWGVWFPGAEARSYSGRRLRGGERHQIRGRMVDFCWHAHSTAWIRSAEGLLGVVILGGRHFEGNEVATPTQIQIQKQNHTVLEHRFEK